MAVKEMHLTSENPEPVYDYYIDVEVYHNIDDPINETRIDSIYANSSHYNGRIVNTWNYGYSNTEFTKQKFVKGCGEVSYYKCYWLVNDYFEKNDELIYFNKGGEEWGIPNIVVSAEENYAIANSIQIIPNPTRDFIIIENNKAGAGEIEIFSLTGKSIKRTIFSNNQKINISELKPGIYILKIEQGGQQIFKKLIKE
jgi:hypothetical protein